ncbi:UNVERIFIED_CONTAM: putative AC transposase [Sesamum angustifolium]|uniref:AC transposase n=1 Tax=Sesamum angustifolium TaxID=2727405 RepID=A0AAW2INP1_9LAMI
MYKTVGKGDRVKSELEKYLGEDVEMHRDKFDILNWWKVNTQRFPILSKMARDVLAVPVSTVASESAFSTGGRVLDAFRSSLSPKIVQALICTQDWLRKDSKPISIEEDLSELEVVEKWIMIMNPLFKQVPEPDGYPTYPSYLGVRVRVHVRFFTIRHVRYPTPNNPNPRNPTRRPPLTGAAGAEDEGFLQY